MAGALAWVCDWTWAWTWIPELLESLCVFIRDKRIIENANIITIITIGLISLLLLRKDTRQSLLNIIKKTFEVFRGRWLPRMDSGESLLKTWRCYFAKVWPSMKETFTESLKLAAYPVHFALRLAARFLLLLAILVTVLMTPLLYPVYLVLYPVYLVIRLDFLRLAPFVAWFLLLLTILAAILISSLILISIVSDLGWNIGLLESLRAFIREDLKSENVNIITIIALLASIGLFSFLLQKSVEDIRKSLSNIRAKSSKSFGTNGGQR